LTVANVFDGEVSGQRDAAENFATWRRTGPRTVSRPGTRLEHGLL